MATTMVMPVSRKGTEKSITFSLSGVMVKAATDRSAWPDISSPTTPVHSVPLGYTDKQNIGTTGLHRQNKTCH